MARFNVRNIVTNSIAKTTEMNAEATVGGYGRFDEGDNVWLDGNGKRPEQRVPTKENNSAREKAISDALDRRAAYMKAKFGVDLKGSFRPRTAEEVAELATTCFKWMKKADESVGRNPEAATRLNERVATLAANLKSVVGFRVCRGLLRQSLSAVTRAAGVTPELSKKLRVMDSTGPSRNADEQDKRDRLVDSVEESMNGLRCMMDLGFAVEAAAAEVGLYDFKGNRVMDLEVGVELVTSVIGLEMGSRKGQARFSMGGYLPKGASQQAIDEHKAALAAAYRKVEEGEAELAKEVALLVEIPKRRYSAPDAEVEAAVARLAATFGSKKAAYEEVERRRIEDRRLAADMEATFRLKNSLVIRGATLAEQTGKTVVGDKSEGSMFEKEHKAIAQRLAQPEYQMRVEKVYDEEGNVINPNEGKVIPNILGGGWSGRSRVVTPDVNALEDATLACTALESTDPFADFRKANEDYRAALAADAEADAKAELKAEAEAKAAEKAEVVVVVKAEAEAEYAFDDEGDDTANILAELEAIRAEQNRKLAAGEVTQEELDEQQATRYTNAFNKVMAEVAEGIERNRAYWAAIRGDNA